MIVRRVSKFSFRPLTLPPAAPKLELLGTELVVLRSQCFPLPISDQPADLFVSFGLIFLQGQDGCILAEASGGQARALHHAVCSALYPLLSLAEDPATSGAQSLFRLWA